MLKKEDKDGIIAFLIETLKKIQKLDRYAEVTRYSSSYTYSDDVKDIVDKALIEVTF